MDFPFSIREIKFKAVIFLSFTFLVATFHAQNFDIDLLKKINVERDIALDPMFKVITNSCIILWNCHFIRSKIQLRIERGLPIYSYYVIQLKIIGFSTEMNS